MPSPQNNQKGLLGGGVREGNISPETQPFLKRAVELLYDENFENLVKMFTTAGQQGFAQAMTNAILGVLDRLGKESPDMSDQAIAEVAFTVYTLLSEDLMEEGIIKDVTAQDEMQILEAVIQGWSKRNPGRLDMDELKSGLKAGLQEGGAQAPGPGQGPQGAPGV